MNNSKLLETVINHLQPLSYPLYPWNPSNPKFETRDPNYGWSEILDECKELNLPNDFDMLFLQNIYIKFKKNKKYQFEDNLFFVNDEKVSDTAGNYIISKNFSNFLFRKFQEEKLIKDPIDIWLNKYMKHKNIFYVKKKM